MDEGNSGERAVMGHSRTIRKLNLQPHDQETRAQDPAAECAPRETGSFVATFQREDQQ